MLRIKKNPTKKPAVDVIFESPSTLKSAGVDMLIALNMTPKTCLTGPEVGINSKVLVTKAKPHFLFNPNISEPKDLQSEPKDSIICISYTNYQGEDQEITMTDEDGTIRQAIDHLHNGIKRAQRKKV